MTLVIAVRCGQGAAVIADRRSRIVVGGKVSFDDNYGKILETPTALVYNHGYNRINDRDWKLSGDQLKPDEKAPVYNSIASEVRRKSDKKAEFVFWGARSAKEIIICAGKRPKLNRISDRHDRIVSGSGKGYVNPSNLTDLSRRSLDEVTSLLKETFIAAHDQLARDGGDCFIKDFDLRVIRK